MRERFELSQQKINPEGAPDNRWQFGRRSSTGKDDYGAADQFEPVGEAARDRQMTAKSLSATGSSQQRLQQLKLAEKMLMLHYQDQTQEEEIDDQADYYDVSEMMSNIRLLIDRTEDERQRKITVAKTYKSGDNRRNSAPRSSQQRPKQANASRRPHSSSQLSK